MPLCFLPKQGLLLVNCGGRFFCVHNPARSTDLHACLSDTHLPGRQAHTATVCRGLSLASCEQSQGGNTVLSKTNESDLTVSPENRSKDRALESESYVEQTMPGILSTRDLTFLFVLIVFFITNDSNAAAGGPAGMALWVIGGLLFFIPCGIASAQLGAFFPHEGSLYSWTHRTFGGFMSFFVGFAAWVPGPLLILATAELVVNIVQGLNSKWLVEPWEQGAALVVVIVFSCIVAVQRHRVVQNMVNLTFALILLATALVFFAGLVWLLTKQPSATNFSQAAGWNPFTGANFPLFGIITLGYLGVNLPLNMGGEVLAPHGEARRRAITGHILWGSLIVLACYLLTTFGILVVQGQNASFVLFSPVSTVDMALGKVAGGLTAVCIMAVLVMATIVYNNVFSRFLLVASIDRRIPMRWARLNRNRAPAPAIMLQTGIACALAVLFFMVIPYVGLLSGPPAHLAASFYFVLVGTATVLWAFATIFLFVNLLVLMFRQGKSFRLHLVVPSWVLLLSSLVGLTVGLVAIVDTVLNSYDPPDITNTNWLYFVTGLTVAVLVMGSIGGMLASSEASWQGMEAPDE
jgi:glutamate:GABA antiporter